MFCANPTAYAIGCSLSPSGLPANASSGIARKRLNCCLYDQRRLHERVLFTSATIAEARCHSCSQRQKVKRFDENLHVEKKRLPRISRSFSSMPSRPVKWHGEC